MISICVTIISIGFSIWSFCSAKKAKQYKEETLQFKENIDLKGFLSRFQMESRYFLEKTRNRDWYKGIDVNTVISPFKDVLLNFGQWYHLVKESDVLKKKVYELNDIIQTYDKATSSNKKRVNILIMEITDILQQGIHSNIDKYIKH